MDKIIKIPVDTGKVVISEDIKSILKNLFSGCRVSFLLGAGFSANLLGTLSNNEVIFEALQKYQPILDHSLLFDSNMKKLWHSNPTGTDHADL